MAEVRQCFGSGAGDLLLKQCKRFILKSHAHYSRNAARAASLSVGLLLDDTLNVRLYGAQDAATGGAAGASQECYATVTRESRGCPGLYSFAVSSQTQAQTFPRKPPRYHTHVKVRRTSFGSLRGHRSPGRMPLPSGQLACVRAYSGSGNGFGSGSGSEPAYKTKTGYYDILEVVPTATHAQIKTAYYKQSFIYHPDRNAGSDDATARFSEISEAYMVLGNKGLRKKYDRGLLTLADLTATRRPSGKDTTGGSAKQQSRRSVMSTEQQGGVFDFDLFFKSHYSDQLQRQREIRVRKEQMQKRKEESMAEKKMDWVMEIGVGVLLLMAMGLVLSLRRQ